MDKKAVFLFYCFLFFVFVTCFVWSVWTEQRQKLDDDDVFLFAGEIVSSKQSAIKHFAFCLLLRSQVLACLFKCWQDVFIARLNVFPVKLY